MVRARSQRSQEIGNNFSWRGLEFAVIALGSAQQCMEYLYASLSNTDDMRVVPSKSHDDLSKDQLLNDVTNTRGIVGAAQQAAPRCAMDEVCDGRRLLHCERHRALV